MFCLPPLQSKKFISALKDGSITPEKLTSFESSEARREFLSEFVGAENAKEVNTLIESKMLLKDFKTGLVSGIKKMTGLQPAQKNDIISKVEKMSHLLDPKSQEDFLQDIASKKLGADVTFEEAKKITDLSHAIQEARSKVTITPGDYLKGKETSEQKKDRLAYGEQIRTLSDYLDSLNPKVNKNVISNIANIPKTAMSTLDFSAPFRQGWGMISRPQFWKAFPKMFKYAFSKKAYNTLQADILSRPTYDLMKKSGLRISVLADKLSQREEQFMSTLLNKVPGVKASERAYVGFLNKVRADVFDNLIASAELRGEDIGIHSQTIKDIAHVVNDFTGSGNIGTNDKYSNAVPALNASFFSPRKISATVNMFNPERYLNPNISKTARLAALRQLIGSVAATSTILGLLALNGEKVESDPKSSDFGKVVNNKTHFDLTGGNGTFLVLLSRLITNKTKSTTTGKIKDLGIGYKPTTRADLTLKFARNKLSPIGSLFADWLYGSDSMGKPFDASSELLNRVKPLIISDLKTLIHDDPNNAILGTVANMFGIGIQTY